MTMAGRTAAQITSHRHKTHGNGQLKPLVDRLNAAQLARREKRAEDRGTFRREISLEHAKTRGLAMSLAMVMRRGFFGRLKWFLFGR